MRLACAAFRYSARGSNCVGGPSVVSPLSLVLGSGSAWSWESPAIGSRVARGSVSMNETTHTASSHGASPRVVVHPPVERAASVSEGAPPPVGLLRGRSWGSASLGGNDVVDNAIPRSNDPGWPVPHPQGAQGHDQHHGLGAAALAAAPLMGSQSVGSRRSASAENVEANYTSDQPDGSDGLDADPWGTRLRPNEGWPHGHGLRHRPWIPHLGKPQRTHRQRTLGQIAQPRGPTARRGHGPPERRITAAA